LAKDKPKIVRPKTPKIVAASQVPQSFEELEALMGKADAQAIEREAKRADMMDRVARYRWWIAQHAHRLDSGQKLDFGRYPYQKDIYQDRNPYMVVVGSVQWGKTEWLICTAIALAMCGMGVFYVIDKYEKRDKIVSSRIDPTLHNVPFYKELLRHAAANARSVDNTRFKHIGHGFINFVGSNSEGDFSSYKADCAIIDEHQLCVLNNIAKIDFRMKGSRVPVPLHRRQPQEGRQQGQPQPRLRVPADRPEEVARPLRRVRQGAGDPLVHPRRQGGPRPQDRRRQERDLA
jgi:hypothetical protein